MRTILPYSADRPRVSRRAVYVILIWIGLPCVIGLIIGGLLVGRALYNLDNFKITLEVANETTATIPEVDFVFDGKAYPIKNIAPGSTASLPVVLHGTSSLKYEITGSDGSHQTGEAKSYLDPDNRGLKIGLRVKPNATEVFLEPW